MPRGDVEGQYAKGAWENHEALQAQFDAIKDRKGCKLFAVALFGVAFTALSTIPVVACYIG